MRTETRAPEVAGLFYPAAADACAAAVAGHVAAAAPVAVAPKAIVAPHAGYAYSGPIAGTAYRVLAGRAAGIRRVVLLGPAHRMAFRGMAVATAARWRTPLGEVPIDWPALAPVLALPGVAVSDAPFAGEHGLEVHLPFLQRTFGDVALAPILVGDADPRSVAEALRLLWGGPETLIVISSDLSHFHDYDTARGKDGAASRAIETLHADLLKADQACGHRAIRGLLHEARRHDLRATALDLRNSGDTAGPRDRVVGYGAFAFEYARQARLDPPRRLGLMKLAAAVLRHGVRHGTVPDVRLQGPVPELAAVRASFVTLTLDGRLKGCIGSLAPCRPLFQDVALNAYKAAFGDPRFPPLAAAELDRLHLGVSILSTPRPVPASSEAELVRALRPDVDGVILRDGDKQGLFLPQVWASVPRAEDFVQHLKLKAGLARGHWSDSVRAFRFSTESFGADVRALG